MTEALGKPPTPRAIWYRKKPVIVEAVQWRGIGDHPNVLKLEQYKPVMCEECGKSLQGTHGWIRTKEGGHIVCPGDYIVTGIRGEQYPVKDEIFQETYELVAVVLPS